MEEQKIQPEDEELPKAEKSGGKLAGGGHPKSGASKSESGRRRLPKIEEPGGGRTSGNYPAFQKSSGDFLHILCRLREWNAAVPGAYGSSGKTFVR